MHQNKLFNQTRGRLAGWYAMVMGVILSLSGLVTYQMVAYSHWHAVEQELESVSGTLHDNLESKLRQPGKLEPSVEAALPGLCLANQSCVSQSDNSGRHILGIVQQNGYYLRFLEQSGQAIALLGQFPDETSADIQEGWKTVKGSDGTRYQQISLLLKTADGTPWGYMQVGRSLKEYDDHLTTLWWLFLIGLPAGVILVGGTGWWLAGLSMKPIYQSYERMQQFTADAAHELRTPVAAIRATVEAAQDIHPLSEAEIQDTLAVVARQNKRLAQLVQDLLLLSRMDQKTYSIKHSACCLNDLVADLVEELVVLEIAKAIKLTHQIRVNKPLWVMGDEAQLNRLISNLVTNALQYTPDGGEVAVVLEQDDHHALIHIQDTGIGIAPADQARIFDRFYRVNSDRSRHTGGAGLGLAIARAIARSHQGDVKVQSELGKGSVFTVRLPLKIPPH
ncbi:MAG: two-component system sensor histidine kinase RppB [Leptolyngbyaceae cyanobacterium bins.302]|nr:two-component system sensor histidine kinase RppB [Leptolyngbyaceae cyanobacterium bins.302]